MTKTNKLYHFCTKEFYKKLKRENKINAGNIAYSTPDNNRYAYKYIFEEKSINAGNGMFFLWNDKKNKGNEIKYCSKDNAKYMLLELEVPTEISIVTNYDNWCSFIMDLYEADGDYQLADEICREEYGIKDGLEGSYKSIYEFDYEYDILQVLVPYICFDWIKNIDYVENKII